MKKKKGGGVKSFTKGRGAWKKITQIFLEKLCLHNFLCGWPIIFMTKNGPWHLSGLERGGGGNKNFGDFLHLGPLSKCLKMATYLPPGSAAPESYNTVYISR